MSPITSVSRDDSPDRVETSKRLWQLIPVFCLFLFILVYVVAVWTQIGQTLENDALAGAKIDPSNIMKDASDKLAFISKASLLVGTVIIGIIGFLRRGTKLAIAGMGVIVLSVFIAETLKHFILPRPDLLGAAEQISNNSYPSGHTTIAMSFLVASILVVPYRFRTLAMIIVMTWATGIGAATIAAHWHRLSDTIGSDLLALSMGCLFSLWLLKNGLITEMESKKKYPLRVSFVVFLTSSMILALIIGITLVILTINNVEWSSADFDIDIYQAVHTLAYAGSVLTGLIFWRTWYKIEIPSTHRQ